MSAIRQTSNLRRVSFGEEKKEERRRTNHSMKILWSALLHRATITKTETQQWQTGYSPRPPTSTDRNEILRGGWSSDGSSKIRISSKSVKWFQRCGVSKFAHPHWLGHWLILYNSLYYRTSCDYRSLLSIHFTLSVVSRTDSVILYVNLILVFLFLTHLARVSSHFSVDSSLSSSVTLSLFYPGFTLTWSTNSAHYRVSSSPKTAFAD